MVQNASLPDFGRKGAIEVAASPGFPGSPSPTWASVFAFIWPRGIRIRSIEAAETARPDGNPAKALESNRKVRANGFPAPQVRKMRVSGFQVAQRFRISVTQRLSRQ